MKSLLIALALSLPAFAQPGDVISCKLSLLNSLNAKTLFGKTELYKARNVCKNYSVSDVPFGGTDIELSLGTVNTLSQSDAEALINHSYNNQGPKKAENILTNVAMGIALGAASGSPIVLSARTLAYLLFGLTFGQKVILPIFTADIPQLDLSNPCGSIPADYVLKSGSAIACTVYVQKPPVGAPKLPSTITYNIALSAPTPGPLPPVSPLLRRPLPALQAPPSPIQIAPPSGITLPKEGSLGVIPPEFMIDKDRVDPQMLAFYRGKTYATQDRIQLAQK